ncbi:hypothetical protein DM860_004255 [Cuscuta australis]|uniref:DUF7953 domain-containing protein n=1 Tax=Cuscuta australis TaxID=267555 RepID=A0A328E711_9ASTE|nr:hypothetical protein DM860_004255 [Cuscuta australis]
MAIRCRLRRSEPSIMLLLYCSILLSSIPEMISAANVTLDSIQIFQTHETTSHDPTVYFKCEDEDKKSLSDVKEINTLYNNFTQPLTQFLDEKCKQCGFYEEDTLNIDETFDEWELCPSNFKNAGGKCTHSKENEVSATFSCPDCVTLVGSDAAPPVNSFSRNDSSHFFAAPSANSFSRNEKRGLNWILALPVAILVLAFSILGG